MMRKLHSPRFWVVTLAAVLVAGVTFSLGQWQLRRAAQKESLQASIESQRQRAPLDVASLLPAASSPDVIHRPAVLRGSWRADQTIYLDNRPMAGKTGFVVVTPLMLEGTNQAILVQRGWVLRDFTDRARLPAVETPSGVVSVEGRIAPPPSKLYEFSGASGGRIRQNLDLSAFRLETGLPLLEVSMLQTGAASEGLLRQWAAPDYGVEKHYGYAFQWFGLCALVLVLYAWFQWIAPFRSSTRGPGRDTLP
ncbi:SURF1 family protein [Polaromonas sp. YR568]|uniref:SURF1 family protein n=1 Tax=Polaromonas sp. YR568 TaxID=1855301 RepID=UPI0031384374